MTILGAIIGDIVGSRFEWNNIKTKQFEFFSKQSFVTDDSVMTLAIAKAFTECKEDYSDLGEKTIHYMQLLGRKYPDSDYGSFFSVWLNSRDPKPYNSYGNGAAMRVSAVGIVGKSLEETIKLSRIVTEVTHNHPEGIKGAEATAVAVYLAKSGRTIKEIRKHIHELYYDLNFTLDDIRPSYYFDVTCQGTVPQAIVAFLESTSFEDAIRNAISLGGDSDTLAAIAGSIAGAYYGITPEFSKKFVTFLDDKQLNIINEFHLKYDNNN